MIFRYSPNSELFINLFRCVFIRLASLIITAVALLVPVSCNYGAACLTDGVLGPCDRNEAPGVEEIYRTCSNTNLTVG